jgi:hypothetical protein
MHKKRLLVWHLEYVTNINIAHYLLIEDDEEPSTFHEAMKNMNVSI